jgi:hypothetical protein
VEAKIGIDLTGRFEAMSSASVDFQRHPADHFLSTKSVTNHLVHLRLKWFRNVVTIIYVDSYRIESVAEISLMESNI